MRTASERPLVQPEEDLSGDLGRQDQIQVSVIPLQIPTILTLESTPIVAGTGTWIDQEPKTFQYFFAYLLLKKNIYIKNINYYAIIYCSVFEKYFNWLLLNKPARLNRERSLVPLVISVPFIHRWYNQPLFS